MTQTLTANYIETILGGAIGAWVFMWSYRRRYELDERLDAAGKMARWPAVSAGLGATLIPGDNLAATRIVGAIVLIALFAWPNAAYHSVRLARQLGIGRNQ